MFQSPRGDFGFLKRPLPIYAGDNLIRQVSIPSRGFWFFEVKNPQMSNCPIESLFQSPRGDFGFLKLLPVMHVRFP